MTSKTMTALALSGMATRPTPPKARGLPLVGSLPHLIKGGLDFLVEARSRHGDIYTLDLGLTKVIALNHPRHVRHVLVEHARNYSKGGPMWESVRGVIGNGLVASEGSFWLRQRRMIQPQFHKERLAALTGLMVEAIDEGMASWEAASASGLPLDVSRELTRITMKVIVKTMFGTGLGREEADAVGENMHYVLDYMLRDMLLRGLPGWMPVPGRRRFRKAMQEIDRVLFGIIERRSRETTASGDLLTLLLNMVDAQSGERMTPQQLRDEAMTLFLAGYETTAASLSWAFHTLLHQPALVRGLEEEVDASLGGRTPGFADLPTLPRTLRTFQESLRLYPPAYWIPRTAVEEDEIDGFRIPAGAMVAPVVYAIHRHPDLWEDPLRFDPDRFTPERSANRDPLAWIPFGAGQRLCVGKSFALMEGQLILARFAQRYRIEPIAGRVARPQLSGTYRLRDVWVKVSRRSPPAASPGREAPRAASGHGGGCPMGHGARR